MTYCFSRSRFCSMQGQALVEFLIAFGVLMTLFVGVYHLGVLADFRQTMLQASRYAAYQRQIQPDEGQVSTEQIEAQVRERFFGAGASRPSRWADWHGQPLLTDPQAVTLSMQSQPLEAAGASAVQALAGAYGLPRRDLERAEVRAVFRDPWGRPGSALALTAQTTVLADPWSAEGSTGVRRALDATALGVSFGRAIERVGPVVSWGVGLLEDRSPVMPCVNVEVVPPHRLAGAGASTARGCP